MKSIYSEAQALFEYTQSMRRDFHIHPEIAYKEVRTAGVVAQELTALGLEVSTGIAETGVVALLKGAKSGPVIMLRADMDALPISEETGAPYASQTPGAMHACGHDGHTAILLTVARLLYARRSELSGTIKFVFQPAEEGMGGAEKMIAEGVLEKPKVDVALGLHLWNERPLGWVGISNGPAMAGAEIFTVKIIGKGGHGAMPHLANDPILAAAQTITALQGITSRNVAPLEAAVLSVCTIHAGEAFNVIPPEVEMTGTIRTFEPELRQRVLKRFDDIVKGVATSMGCQSAIDMKSISPAVINDPKISKKIQSVANQVLPESTIDPGNYITMGSEDFSFFTAHLPGCYIFLGSANQEKGLNASHHHPHFDFDEAALPRAAALLAAAVLELSTK